MLSSRSGVIEGRPVLLYIASNCFDIDLSTALGHRLDDPQRMVLRNRRSGLMIENIQDCFAPSPRM